MCATEHHLFYSQDLRGDIVHLDAEEARHAWRVLRLRPGDLLRITDGRGAVRLCVLVSADHREAIARIADQQTAPRPQPALVLHVGIPERAAFESTVEAAAALGVTAVVPVTCEYCQNPWWERVWEKQAVRLERKMISAIKQSLNPWLPVLRPPTPFAKDLAAADGMLFVAAPEGRNPYGAVPSVSGAGGGETIHAFVGPPGGFSPQELDAFERRGAVKVRLSRHRLRTELAASAIAALVMARE